MGAGGGGEMTAADAEAIAAALLEDGGGGSGGLHGVDDGGGDFDEAEAMAAGLSAEEVRLMGLRAGGATLQQEEEARQRVGRVRVRARACARACERAHVCLCEGRVTDGERERSVFGSMVWWEEGAAFRN